MHANTVNTHDINVYCATLRTIDGDSMVTDFGDCSIWQFNFATSMLQLVAKCLSIRCSRFVQAHSTFASKILCFNMASIQVPHIVELSKDEDVRNEVLKKLEKLKKFDNENFSVVTSRRLKQIDDSKDRAAKVATAQDRVDRAVNALIKDPATLNSENCFRQIKSINADRYQMSKFEGLYHNPSSDNPINQTMSILKRVKDPMQVDSDRPNLFKIDRKAIESCSTTKQLLKLLFSDSTAFGVNDFEKHDLLDCFKDVIKTPNWISMIENDFLINDHYLFSSSMRMNSRYSSMTMFSVIEQVQNRSSGLQSISLSIP